MSGLDTVESKLRDTHAVVKRWEEFEKKTPYASEWSPDEGRTAPGMADHWKAYDEYQKISMVERYAAIGLDEDDRQRKESGYSDDDRVNDLKSLAEHPLETRIKPATLEKILKDGRMKTAHEGVKASGTNKLDKKTEFENAYMGAEGVPAGERPVYGYMQTEAEHHNTTLDHYGSVRVVLHDEVKDRTSFTIGDSLDRKTFPSPLHAPAVRSSPPGVKSKDDLVKKSQYIETQIWGGVKASDIKHVQFSEEPKPALTKKLTKAGITWTVKS